MKTTKLLLGATLVAGLSLSAFAACATDVDFGGTKKITGLADGTTTGEAVHYGQVFTAITEDVEPNTTNNLVKRTDAWKARYYKVGAMVCIEGLVDANASGFSNGNMFTIPVAFRPTQNVMLRVTSGDINYAANLHITTSTGSAVVAHATETATNTWINIGGCWHQ